MSMSIRVLPRALVPSICCPRSVAVTRNPTTFVRRSMMKLQAQQSHMAHDVSRLACRIPKGAWDTHMHVVDPTNFPLDKAAQYTPSSHTLDQAQAFLGQLGIQKMVIVQPSIYGNDNSCTLDGLKRLGPSNGRAVIQFDPASTTKGQLQEWHDLGVRGVRLNFKSVGGNPTAEELESRLHIYAGAVRPFGWVLELYIALEDVPLLEKAVQKLSGIKICIDHLGHPSARSMKEASTAEDLPGFSSLASLLKRDDVWVKMSASYRLSEDPCDVVVKSLCTKIVKQRPDRCVLATDWPHTRFEKVAVGVYLEKLLDWCEEEGVNLEQVLVKNSEELFDA